LSAYFLVDLVEEVSDEEGDLVEGVFDDEDDSHEVAELETSSEYRVLSIE